MMLFATEERDLGNVSLAPDVGHAELVRGGPSNWRCCELQTRNQSKMKDSCLFLFHRKGHGWLPAERRLDTEHGDL